MSSAKPEWRPAEDELALFNGLSAAALRQQAMLVGAQLHEQDFCSTDDDADDDDDDDDHHHHQGIGDDDDDDDDPQRQHDHQFEDDDDDEQDFAMRLDTIVEEDETNCETMLAQQARQVAAGACDDSNCDSGQLYATTAPQAASCNNTPSKQAQAPARPQAEQASSLRKFTPSVPTMHQPSRLEETSNHKMSNLYLNQPIPSTNRLISEHQARQQQALFKALAERQKLMDELSASGGQRRRRQARRLQSADSDGVPLSLVDLSSMPDRMLDELLGQIAPASSSSSLNSMASSELSSERAFTDQPTTDADSDHERPPTRPNEHQLRAGCRSQATTSGQALVGARAPNVVGVHEDERAVGSQPASSTTLRRPLECRDAHRRRSSPDHQRRDDDDDDQEHQEQSGVRQQAAGQHLSAATSLDESLSPAPTVEPEQAAALGGSRLEHYFTGELIQAHTLNSQTQTADNNCQPDGDDQQVPQEQEDDEQRSVELVLAQMLEALSEIGADDQEQLNELLERGFAHLERLLGCTFSSNHKLISNTPQLLVSKDSDYGSDTQSADCLSGASAVVVGSPSPSSLVGGGGGANSGASLSPAAVELSFKLAESLHRLARQQAARKLANQQASEAPQEAQQVAAAQPRRSPMKSVVMINQQSTATSESSRLSLSSPSSSSVVSCCSPSSESNPTPGKTRAQFKTRVNIGAASSEVSQLELVASTPAVAGRPPEPDEQAVVALQRRRSARSSLRRRPSFSGSLGAGSVRPGSPVPKPLVSHQELTSDNDKQSGLASTNLANQHGRMDETISKAQVGVEEVKQSRQLQRALILAQRYNYSPAKLAASKLNAKLQLNSNSSNNNNSNNNKAAEHHHDDQTDHTGE